MDMTKPPLLKEGDIIKLDESHTVYANVPEHFLFSNKKGSWKLACSDAKLNGELSYLCGDYVVYKTSYDGASEGQGCNDKFPNGHHVFCEKLSDENVKVDFYQTGHFTAMIVYITPLGRAERKWVYNKEK